MFGLDRICTLFALFRIFIKGLQLSTGIRNAEPHWLASRKAFNGIVFHEPKVSIAPRLVIVVHFSLASISLVSGSLSFCPHISLSLSPTVRSTCAAKWKRRVRDEQHCLKSALFFQDPFYLFSSSLRGQWLKKSVALTRWRWLTLCNFLLNSLLPVYCITFWIWVFVRNKGMDFIFLLNFVVLIYGIGTFPDGSKVNGSLSLFLYLSSSFLDSISYYGKRKVNRVHFDDRLFSDNNIDAFEEEWSVLWI